MRELTRDDLQSVVAKASSFWERVRHPEAFEPPEVASGKIEARLRHWRDVAAEGDVERVRRRWSYDSLDEQRLRQCLGKIGNPGVFGLPPWTSILNDVLSVSELGEAGRVDFNDCEKYPFLESDFPVPFEELLLPFVAVAADRINSATPGGYSALRPKVRARLERALLQKLSEICSRVLEMEFRTYLACRQLDGFPYPDPIRGCESREAYFGFVGRIYASSWAPLFQEYCVMAKLMAVAVLQWVERTAEFVHRLTEDLPRIRDAFFAGADPGNLADVRTNLSDSHDGGRSVIALEFESGQKVIYKPKEMGLESEYFRFVEWLNGLGEVLPFRTVKIVEGAGYGWAEFIGNAACESETEVRRFYSRFGAFLCLVHAFNGNDFHFENIIACGEHPVPVDLETIYHQVTEDLPGNLDLTDAVTARLRNSVLATDLLPNRVRINDRYYDISAIARSRGEENSIETLGWRHINTDALGYDYQNVRPGPAGNLPRFEDQYLAPDEYVEEIGEGFRSMYQLLSKRRSEILTHGSPFQRVFRQPSRFIFRATSFYQSVIKRALHPDCLRDGVDFDIQLDMLSRQSSRWPHRPKTWPLVREEIAAFWRMDVPKFTARGDSDSLVLPSGEIATECFVDSAWNLACQKLLRFGAEDLCWQLGLIRASMDVRDAERVVRNTSDPAAGDDSTQLFDTAALLENAIELARGIEAAAVRADNEEPSWLVFTALPQREQFALRAMEFDLYNGRCGLALFFAALEKVVPGRGFGALAYSTLAIVRRWLARAEATDLAALGMGGLTGLPSVIYGLTRVGHFLQDHELLAEAETSARRISPKLIASDKSLDIVVGAAGAILCLLACQRTGAGSEILDIASMCGRHLLKMRRLDRSGNRTWPTLGGRHLTGMSHGAAGIAYALARLSQATGDREFLDAAAEGIRFESCEFVSTKKNWVDLREDKASAGTPDDPVCMVRWCHGAPGIGLARLGGLEGLDSPEIRNDIQAALQTTSRCGLLARDHICCGNMGLVETFLTAGLKLGDPLWTLRALRLTSSVVERARQTGSFRITFRNGFSNPSLFQGAAGVGYQMLRVAFPRLIPAVLLLE